MNKLNGENKAALKQLQKLGKIIYLSNETIRYQKEIRYRANKDFKEILDVYPKAKEVYYNGG